MVVFRYKLVRGASDFGGVVNRATARSRYGGSSPSVQPQKSLLIPPQTAKKPKS
jgi:hypothetical protein